MRTALIGLDYIIDIMHPEGKIAASAAQASARHVIVHANQALQLAQQRGWLRILVKVGFAQGYVDHPAQTAMFRRARELGALEAGSRGMDFHPDLRAELGEQVIIKPRISGFYGTNLDATLRARRIERVVIAGVSTCWAVESTVREAHDRDYEVLILEPACAAATAEEHEQAISRLSRIARVVSLEQLAQVAANASL